MVVRIDDDEVPLGIARQPAGIIELSLCLARFVAEAGQKPTFFVEFLHRMGVCIGHVNVSFWVQRDASRGFKLPVIVAFGPELHHAEIRRRNPHDFF